MIGGAVYEHAAVVPVWAAAVPASLSMFQGEYALQAYRFWIPVHPSAIIFMITAMLLNWDTPRRPYILTALAGYAAVILATFLFFVPELMELTQSTYSTSVDAGLTQRARTWEVLSLVRLAFLFSLAGIMLLGLSKPEQRFAKAA
jgi:hypothetical protein